MKTNLPPEVLISRIKMEDNKIKLNENIVDLLKDIHHNSTLEINGGLGEVSEYLSEFNNCSLTEERGLCEVYRKNLFPASTVKQLIINWKNIAPNPYYDYVIIHDNKDYQNASKLAKIAVINLEQMKVIPNERIDINNTKIVDTVGEIKSNNSEIKQSAKNTNIDILSGGNKKSRKSNDTVDTGPPSSGVLE